MDALDQVQQLGEGKVIFARKPWALDAEADIGVLDENLSVPGSMKSRGLEYFLEADVAKEVLEVFGDRDPTVQEIRALLLFYAENDAYPEWVYGSQSR